MDLQSGLGMNLNLNGAGGTTTFATSNTERMCLTDTSLYTASTINVGIGLSNPAAKLDVATTTGFTYAATSTAGVNIGTQGTAGGSLMVQTASGSSGFGSGLAIDGAYSGGTLISTVNIKAFGVYGSGYASNLAFYTSSGTTLSEKMRLDSSGNLGLGVTPSAWNTDYKAYQLTGGGALFNNGGSTFLALSQNLFVNSLAENKYIATAAATRYRQSAGTHLWDIAPSGTGGVTPDTITFTQAMTLDASGNLLVGTSSSVLGTGGRGVIEINGSSTSVLGLKVDNSLKAEMYTDGTDFYVINDVNGAMRFYTNTTERARITSGGYFKASNAGTYNEATGSYHEFRGNTANSYVVIAACTNATPLSEYIQDFRFSAATPNDGNARFWSCTDATAERAYIRSNGGLSNYSANDTNLSDRREKTNFAPATSYLDKICAIPVQTFNYIDQNFETDDGLTLGVVAQDVQAVAPELVTESNWGSKEEPKMRLSIYQTDLQYALMKCIQEQQALITQLTARITALEGA
jgi:hypothetical protein